MTQPQSPIPQSSFTFLPQNPNPNSESNSLNPKLQTPQPQSLAPNLSATLSSLNDLILRSQHSVQSLLSLLPPQNPNPTHFNGLVSCPFDSRHSVPPNSLFSHFLRCSSSRFPIQPDLLPRPSYPETLNSPSSENGAIRKLRDSDSELCFSLDDFYADFGSNFFYRGCHGVVSLSSLDGLDRTFNLPGFLSIECDNFVGSSGASESNDLDRDQRKILPSEFWAIRAEIESWNDYPGFYSYRVLCVLSGLSILRQSDLAKWLVSNSPRYGVVIDNAMRDHIFLLCNLCLKTIRREALTSADKRDSDKTLGNTNFNCPILVQALTWFSSQLSVLYGEMAGKVFALNILKQCILYTSPSLLIFSLEQKEATESSDSKEVPWCLDAYENVNEGFEAPKALDIRTDEEPNETVGTSITGEVIYVSQVAAAVAALHERSLLEEKIKGLRFHNPLNNHQRMAEHDYLCRRADEERRGRSQYKPIIEHDGIPRLRSSNEETSKAKSREEFLAEERDYKRRRMSYRGKKVKRSSLEVTRDIIEDYMDEIKQAGGIGCFEKVMEREMALPSEPPFASEITKDFFVPNERNHNRSAEYGHSPQQNRKQLHSNYETQSTDSKDRFDKDYDHPKRHYYGDHEVTEYERSIGREKRDRVYDSRSSRDNRSSERSHQRRERKEMNGSETKRHDSKHPSSRTSRHHDDRSTTSLSTPEHKSKSKFRRHKDKYESHISEPLSRNTFEDRYDPSDSGDSSFSRLR